MHNDSLLSIAADDGIVIRNRGPVLSATNYWTGSMAAAGLVYCSWNAGAIRLLVPPSAEHFISEMHTGHEVLITQGPWRRERRPHALELLWEDESDTPFFLLIAEAQFDRLFDENAVGRRVACHVYKRGLLDTPELVGIWPARLRLAPSLPHLKR